MTMRMMLIPCDLWRMEHRFSALWDYSWGLPSTTVVVIFEHVVLVAPHCTACGVLYERPLHQTVFLFLALPIFFVPFVPLCLFCKYREVPLSQHHPNCNEQWRPRSEGRGWERPFGLSTNHAAGHSPSKGKGRSRTPLGASWCFALSFQRPLEICTPAQCPSLSYLSKSHILIGKLSNTTGV